MDTTLNDLCMCPVPHPTLTLTHGPHFRRDGNEVNILLLTEKMTICTFEVDQGHFMNKGVKGNHSPYLKTPLRLFNVALEIGLCIVSCVLNQLVSVKSFRISKTKSNLNVQ